MIDCFFHTQNQKNFGFIQSVTVSWTLPVTDWNITLSFLSSPKRERNTLIVSGDAFAGYDW